MDSSILSGKTITKQPVGAYVRMEMLYLIITDVQEILPLDSIENGAKNIEILRIISIVLPHEQNRIVLKVAN